MNMFPLA